MKFLDRGKIRHITIHLKTEDKVGQRDNAAAVKWMRYLYNLESINFMIGGEEEGWGMTKQHWEEGFQTIQTIPSTSWIPVEKDRFVVLDMESKLRDENRKPPGIVVRNGHGVLASYNETM